MRMVVIFEDTPAMEQLRPRLGAAHIEYLRQNQAEIVIGGGLRSATDDVPLGGLWVLEVPSRERALELIAADPFYQAEQRPYRLMVWGKALPDLQVML